MRQTECIDKTDATALSPKEECFKKDALSWNLTVIQSKQCPQTRYDLWSRLMVKRFGAEYVDDLSDNSVCCSEWLS